MPSSLKNLFLSRIRKSTFAINHRPHHNNAASHLKRGLSPKPSESTFKLHTTPLRSDGSEQQHLRPSHLQGFQGQAVEESFYPVTFGDVRTFPTTISALLHALKDVLRRQTSWSTNTAHSGGLSGVHVIWTHCHDRMPNTPPPFTRLHSASCLSNQDPPHNSESFKPGMATKSSGTVIPGPGSPKM